MRTHLPCFGPFRPVFLLRRKLLSVFLLLVHISVVQGNPCLGASDCSNQKEKAKDKHISGDLYTNSSIEGRKPVQTTFVQGGDGEPGRTLSVMFWNVENFFDWRNDSTTVSDAEFSAAGERHWTWKRFQAKANAFAKALLWVSADTGRLPDIVGLAEVENAFVLRQVLTKTLLRKLDYKYVHYDSPDRRGIDVALLYRSSILELLDSKPCHLYADAGPPSAPGAPGAPGASADSVMATRDILLCIFRDKRGVIPGSTGDLPEIENSPPFEGACGGKFAVLVNHHPSKYGGASESDSRRRLAVQRLRFLADSLSAAGIDRIIAGGDFNDTPDNSVFQLLEPALVPMHTDLFRRGEGTIKYEGKWDLIDHFYVSPGWLSDRTGTASGPAGKLPSSGPAGKQLSTRPAGQQPLMRILRIPFLLTRDTAYTGEKPLRTYVGPRYTGGVSDHLPVLVVVRLPGHDVAAEPP